MKGVAQQVFALIFLLHAPYGLSAPMNDAFEDRTVLSGNHLTVRGTVSGATAELGDPEPSNWMVRWRGTKQTVWWSWTAGARGTLSVNPSASALYEKALVALKGETHANLALLSTALYDETLLFNVTAGETYQIAVATDTIQDDDVLLFLDFTPSPPHDDFANRAHLEGKQFTFSGSFGGATDEVGHPEVHDLWFEWTVPESGRLRLLPLEPGVGALLYRGDTFLTLQPVFPPNMNFTRGDRIVFRVCCGSNVMERPLLHGELDESHLIWEPTATLYREPVLLTFVPDPDYPAPTNVSFPSTTLVRPPWQGVTYFGLSSEKTPVTVRYADGRIEEFFATGKASLPNDNFADAALIPDNGVLSVERIALATREANEPVHSSEFGTNDVSVWWRWRPSRDSYLRVRYDYSMKNHAIYKGNSITGLTRVYPLASVHGTYPMQKGGEYRLAVFSRFDEPRGNIELDFLEPEQNDSFSTRSKLAVEGAVTGRIAAATIEQGEELAPGSLWYEWNAPGKGEVRFDILNPEDVLRDVSSPRFIAVSCYAGSTLSDLKLLPFNPNSDSAAFRKVVEPGERLFIRITGVDYRRDIDEGLFILKWAFDPAPVNDLFRNRTQIESLPFTASYNSKWTTFETGEARLSGSSGLFNTAWWEWTAPTSEPVSLSALSGDIPLRSRAVVKCFTGEGLDSLLEINGETNTWGDLVLSPSAGASYKIAVFANWNVSIRLYVSKSLSNDNFADAAFLPITGSYSSPFTYLGASFEPGEDPNVPFFGQSWPTSGNLWWKFIAPADGLLRNVRGWLYSGAKRAELSLIPSYSDAVTYYNKFSSFWSPVTAGRTYYIETRDLLSGNGDPIGQHLTYEFSTFRLTGITDETIFEFGFAPTVSVHPPDPRFEGLLVGGCALQLFRTDFWSPTPSTVRFDQFPFSFAFTNLPPGAYETYAIGSNSRGEVVHTAPVKFVVRPANDSFANRARIESSASTTLSGASFEVDEDALMPTNATGSVWFEWIAPATEFVRVSASHAYGVAGTLAVFTGSSPGNLQPVAEASSAVIFRAQAGTAYNFAVLKTATNSTLNVALTVQTPPANDNFLSASVIQPWLNSSSIGGDVSLCSIELGESVSPGLVGSAWWRWSPGFGGSLSLAGDLKNWDIFRGDNLARLERVVVPSTDAAIQITPGGTYYFRQNRFLTNRTYSQLELTYVAMAANDRFTDALPLETPARVSLENSQAPVEPLEPGTDGGQPLGSQWWKWIPRMSGPAEGSITRSWTIELFQGDELGSLMEIGPNRVEFADQQRYDTWTVQAGQVYWVRASHTGQFPGPGEFRLDQPSVWSIPNDHFVDRTQVEGDRFHISGSARGSTLEPGEAGSAGSLWWTWKCPRSGLLRLWWPRSTSVRAYRGNSLQNLDLIVDWPTTFPVAKGEEIQVAVYRGVEASFEWNLELLEPALNIDMSLAADLEPNARVFANLSAVPARLESDGSSIETVGLYWKWTAPQAGRLRVSTEGQLRVYIAPGWVSDVQAVAGRTYYFAALGRVPGHFDITFDPAQWRISTSLRNDRTLSVELGGPSDGVITLDQSSDLQTWTAWQTLRYSGATNILQIPIVLENPSLFIRALPLR